MPGDRIRLYTPCLAPVKRARGVVLVVDVTLDAVEAEVHVQLHSHLSENNKLFVFILEISKHLFWRQIIHDKIRNLKEYYIGCGFRNPLLASECSSDLMDSKKWPVLRKMQHRMAVATKMQNTVVISTRNI